MGLDKVRLGYDHKNLTPELKDIPEQSETVARATMELHESISPRASLSSNMSKHLQPASAVPMMFSVFCIKFQHPAVLCLLDAQSFQDVREAKGPITDKLGVTAHVAKPKASPKTWLWITELQL